MPYAAVNDIRLYYEETGSGPPLLLLNGIGGSTEGFASLVQTLTDRFRVINFDARGAGRSSAPPGPYVMRQLADDAVALLDHLGLAQVHVFGLSFGGMIAQELALAYPARVDRLVLIATTAFCVPAFWDAWGTCLVQAEERELDRAGVALWFLAWMFTPAFMADHAQVEAVLTQWVSGPNLTPVHGLSAQMAAARSHDTREWLPQIAAPTLVVVGDQDILTPVADARELAAGIPGARLRVLAGGGHLALAECNDAFMDALMAFLVA